MNTYAHFYDFLWSLAHSLCSEVDLSWAFVEMHFRPEPGVYAFEGVRRTDEAYVQEHAIRTSEGVVKVWMGLDVPGKTIFYSENIKVEAE